MIILDLKSILCQVPVTHACNPSYMGVWDQEDCGLRPAQANSSWDSNLQNNQSKMEWRCGSSSRTPALRIWSPELKPQSQQNKKNILHFYL
jgi:hypothetical protein